MISVYLLLDFSPAHAAGQTEGGGDGGEDGDDHVDDQLPGFFLAFL